MKNEPKKSSAIPIVIIVGVLIVVVVGIYAFSRSSAPLKGNTNTITAVNTTKTPQTPINAPPGAQPPNMLGSPNALVTVEEFADFQCPSCGAAHPAMREIQQIYGSKIKFIFRNFPLAIPAHDKAYDAAVAAEAAGMQDRTKFWAMQDLLYTNQATWSPNPNFRQLWLEYAGKIGLDVAKFQIDMAGSTAKTRVDEDLKRGRGLSVNSTPTIFVNGRSVPFPDVNVTSLRQIIDAELQLAASSTEKSANTANTGNTASTSK